MIKDFVLHWLDGQTEIVHGISISAALTNAGYGHGALKALDDYSELKTERDRMDAKLESYTYENLQQYWESLMHDGWDRNSNYAPGIPMDEWVQKLNAEIERRKAGKNLLSKG